MRHGPATVLKGRCSEGAIRDRIQVSVNAVTQDLVRNLFMFVDLSPAATYYVPLLASFSAWL